MAWPASVITRTLSFGKAVVLETGADLSLRAVTRASRSLVSMAEGFRMESQSASFETADAGEEILFPLPVTDQPGWADAATRMAIEVGDDQHSHLYTTTLTIYSGASTLRQYTIGPYPVPQGEGVLDADTMLVPSGTEPGTLVPLPEIWSQIIEDANAIVNLRGLPDGIAELDGSGVVPDDQLPDRLSEAGLRDTFVGDGSNILLAPRASGYSINIVDDGSSQGVMQRFQHMGLGYAFDISNRPGAGAAFVIHQYSEAQSAVQWDNTTSRPMLLMRNTNNPLLNPDGPADGESATGDFIRAVNATGTPLFRILGRGELVIQPGADALAHTIEIVGNAASSKKQLRITGNGPSITAEITATAGSAGFFPLLVTGYDYGPRFTTSQNGSNRFALELIKSGTGIGDALRIINQGTGKTVTFRTASSTEVAAINADGEYEHMTAGKGIILRSPDGTRYRMAVADGGAVSAVAA